MKRTQFPSRRWIRLWERALVRAGGGDGPATIKALTPRAVELYHLGGTPAAVGAATAREYQLYSSLQGWMELAAL